MKTRTNLLLVFMFFFLGTQVVQAQTYSIDSNGRTCLGNTGIDATYNCSVGGAAATIGSFTDTNPAGYTLDAMNLTFYDACQGGDINFYMNGVLIHSATLPTGLSCSCQSIASDPLILKTILLPLLPLSRLPSLQEESIR